MKQALSVFLAAATLAACSSNSVKTGPIEYVAAPKSVSLQAPVPFEDGNTIQRNIIDDCAIDRQLAQFVSEFATENGIEVELKDKVTQADAGSVLILEIVDAVSLGNAFIGHKKFTRIRGTLFDNGVEIASFNGGRQSSGGAFAGFKSSCSVLGRTVRALGNDVALWLKKPWKDATLGDL
jgi:hypothetical protein